MLNEHFYLIVLSCKGCALSIQTIKSSTRLDLIYEIHIFQQKDNSKTILVHIQILLAEYG